MNSKEKILKPRTGSNKTLITEVNKRIKNRSDDKKLPEDFTPVVSEYDDEMKDWDVTLIDGLEEE